VTQFSIGAWPNFDLTYTKSIEDIHNRLESVLRNKSYLEKATTGHNNWLEIPIVDVIENVLAFFKDFD